MGEQLDNLLMSEVEAYETLPYFFEEAARDHFISCQRIGSSSAVGVHD